MTRKNFDRIRNAMITWFNAMSRDEFEAELKKRGLGFGCASSHDNDSSKGNKSTSTTQ